MRLLVVGMALVTTGFSPAAGDEPRKAAPVNTEDRADDRKAIQDADAAFVRAYNAGDAKAVGTLFAEDAEAVDEEGETVRGRKAIEGLFGAIFEDAPGAKLDVVKDGLRFLGADVALETGRSTVTPAGAGTPEVGRFTVIFAKKDGRWLQAYVREHPETRLSHHDRLKELGWMVGEWVDESDDAVVSTTCQWSKDKNYLLREFKLRIGGKAALDGTQRIGWDPLTRQIKSWVFDSEGGRSEGSWAREGDQWIVKTSGSLQDGRTASSTQVITRVNKDMFRWKTMDRTVGGKPVAESEEIVIVRKPPQPH